MEESIGPNLFTPSISPSSSPLRNARAVLAVAASDDLNWMAVLKSRSSQGLVLHLREPGARRGVHSRSARVH